MNAEILKKEKWDVEDIIFRTKEIAKQVIALYPYEESAYSGITENQYIMLNAHVKAQAIFYDNNSVEVLKGSEVVSYDGQVNPSCPPSYIDLYDSLLEEGVIVRKRNQVVFAKNYMFTSVSAAAGFILQGSRNGWDYWKHQDGSAINDLLEE